jgi:hypothetical protein
MTTEHDSPNQVRQLVVRRLRGMLNGLDRAGRQPNRREAYYVCQSLEHLQADRLSQSEAAMLNAQRRSPLPLDLASSPASNKPPILQELRQALDKLALEQRRAD